MPLFRHHPFRSIAYALGLAIAVHFVHKFIPDTHFAFSMTSTSVAILALSSLAIMTVAHHTRQGQVMTQTQEEMLLIGAFGLFWLSMLVILRAYRSRNDLPNAGAGAGTSVAVGSSRNPAPGAARRPDWCGKDSTLCIIEEWIHSPY